MKKIIITGIILFVIFTFNTCVNNKENDNPQGSQQWVTDSEKFALEYPLVGDNNIFVIRNIEQTAEILERGTGIIFLGFKECSWCQVYVVFLQEAALEMDIKRIFYCDIREDRLNNTEGYQRIVNILDGQLQYDDEGRPRVYVPDVTIVNSGKIIGRDFETSKYTLGYETAEEYWNEDRVTALKNRLKEGMSQLDTKCYPCD
ncbi:MAG: hypothetical protein FWD13_12525 [Treponema sp.]|nr:hypothetical protein [Treponema sp.]